MTPPSRSSGANVILDADLSDALRLCADAADAEILTSDHAEGMPPPGYLHASDAAAGGGIGGAGII